MTTLAVFSSIIGLIEFLIGCGTLVTITFFVTLALPESPTRKFAVQCAGWCVAAFAGAYLISPFDLVPEGLVGPLLGGFDDLAVGIFGIAAAYAARKAGKDAKEVSDQLTQTLKARHVRGQRSRHQQKSDAN